MESRQDASECTWQDVSRHSIRWKNEVQAAADPDEAKKAKAGRKAWRHQTVWQLLQKSYCLAGIFCCMELFN